MFLILLIVSALALHSIIACLIMASCYGVVLILLVSLIRNSRQEVSRDGLGRLLFFISLDHAISAVLALILGAIIVWLPKSHEFLTLVTGTRVDNEAMLISIALILTFFAMLWTTVGIFLWLLRESLKTRGSVQSELEWEPWLTVGFVVGCVLQLTTAILLFLMICVPFLLHVRRMARINQQGNLLWTLSLAVRRGLPLGPEVRNLSEGLWGRQRQRLKWLSENLDSGQSLSNSLERQPGLLPLSAVAQLRMGEETGMLSEAMTLCAAGLAGRCAKDGELAAPLNSFMIIMLPIMLLPLVAGWLGYFIVPKYKKIMLDFGTEPPEMTKLVFSLLGNDLGIPTFMSLLSIVCAIAVGTLLMRDWERDWPFLSWLFPRTNAPLILRSLALLVREGRPLTTGLRALESSHPRQTVRVQLVRVLSQIDQGSDAWDALAKQRLLAPRELLLLRSAERLRNLPWALEQIADTIDRSSWLRLRVVLEIILPVATVVVGLMVLALSLCFALPVIEVINTMSALNN